MKSMYTISEVARYFNVSKQTLHYYDRIGLFKPSYVDPQTKYRYYDQQQFNKMFMIQELKSMGFSLDEIAKVQENKNLESLAIIIRKNRQELLTRMDELNQLKEHMDFYLDMIDLSRHPRRRGKCSVRFIPERYAFYINTIFALQDLSKPVEIIYKAYVKAAKLRLTMTRSNKMILTIDRSQLEQGEFRYYSGMGLLLPHPIDHPNAHTIKESLYATTIHVGEYDSLPVSYRKLCAYIKEGGYAICGPATEVSLASIIQTHNPKEFVTELQIPVVRTDGGESGGKARPTDIDERKSEPL